MTGTWYPPAAGTGGFLLTNPPFAMTATDRIRAAIERCINASPAPPTTDDLAAAVLREAAAALFPEKPEPIEPRPLTPVEAIRHAGEWSAWRALHAANERLQALAQQLNGTDYGQATDG